MPFVFDMFYSYPLNSPAVFPSGGYVDVSTGDACSMFLLLENQILFRLSLHTPIARENRFSRADVCQIGCCEVFTSLEIQLLGDLSYAHTYV